jgi:hypothetical protein
MRRDCLKATVATHPLSHTIFSIHPLRALGVRSTGLGIILNFRILRISSGQFHLPVRCSVLMRSAVPQTRPVSQALPHRQNFPSSSPHLQIHWHDHASARLPHCIAAVKFFITASIIIMAPEDGSAPLPRKVRSACRRCRQKRVKVIAFLYLSH